MAAMFFEVDEGVKFLIGVTEEKDLKLRPGININPPPSDGRCDCCGRYLSELKPFGKAGDPLVGDFNGVLLLKTFKPDFPPDEEAERILDEFFQGCHSEEDHRRARKKLIQTYGEEEAERMQLRVSASNQIGSFWLCRDCIILEDDEFYGTLFERERIDALRLETEPS